MKSKGRVSLTWGAGGNPDTGTMEVRYVEEFVGERAEDKAATDGVKVHRTKPCRLQCLGVAVSYFLCYLLEVCRPLGKQMFGVDYLKKACFVA